MSEKKFVIEVEKAKEAQDEIPSFGPVYRNFADKDGFTTPPAGMDTCWDVFRLSVEENPDNRMLGHREIANGKAGKYVWKTYKEVYDVVIKVGKAIRASGIEQHGKCGMYGANCAEWIISMEACNAHGIYCVPLYDTLGATAVEYIICHSEVSLAFVEEKKISELLKAFPNVAGHLKTIVSFGNIPPEQKEEIEKLSLVSYSWEEFVKLGEDKEFDLPEKKPTDICTIMYTSGTTGDPKGVLISNESIITLIGGVNRMLESKNEKLTAKDVFLSYLPLAHIFDRVLEELMISHAASIGFWRGDIKLIMEDVSALKPSIFCAVPRVLDRLHTGMAEKVTSGGLLKKTLFNAAFSYKLSSLQKGSSSHDAFPICNKMVFNKVKHALGSHVRIIISGAAPLARQVESFLRVASCAHVLQGYGLTESCAGSFVSLPGEMGMLGTVGPPLPNVEACLQSVPEMDYDALSDTPRGEICLRGKTVFSGYYKSEDLTKEVLIDGWLHTGDIGEWQPDGSMKVIDRKKNIFKLSQGEYVAVENLENIYGLVSAIDSIWVYGSSLESFLVAVVNPSEKALEKWAKDNSISESFSALCENSKAKEYILGELTNCSKEKKLKGFEAIKAVHLDPVPFDVERDLLTPTYKKKRPQLLKHYQTVIDDLYKSINEPKTE